MSLIGLFRLRAAFLHCMAFSRWT